MLNAQYVEYEEGRVREMYCIYPEAGHDMEPGQMKTKERGGLYQLNCYLNNLKLEVKHLDASRNTFRVLPTLLPCRQKDVVCGILTYLCGNCLNTYILCT